MTRKGDSADRAVSSKELKAFRSQIDKLDIQVSDDEVRALIREQAEEAGEDADNVIDELWHAGRHEDVREDIRLRSALDRIVAEVKPIPVEVAAARDAIWTPDKEKPDTETKLWTPGNDPPGTKEPA